jgi:hypothetical protein
VTDNTPLNFKRGIETDLDSINLSDGTIYYCYDTGNLYIAHQYIDESGQSQIKKTFINPVPKYAVCETAANIQIKKVTVDNYKLSLGARIAVKFLYTGSAANPKLEVNGTTACPIYYKGSPISASYLKANYIYEFVFDGTNYVLIGDVDTNTTYTNPKLGQGYGTLEANDDDTTGTNKLALLSSYSLTVGGIVSIKFNENVVQGPNNEQVTLNINSKGAKPIYYKGAAITDNIIKENDLATFIYDGSYYHLIAIDRW